jgi:hypothetical protein
MLAHYSHVRLEAKRNALEALSRPAQKPVPPEAPKREFSKGSEGDDTNHDTNKAESEGTPAEVFEGSGRHEETRTPDLYRVKVAL